MPLLAVIVPAHRADAAACGTTRHPPQRQRLAGGDHRFARASSASRVLPESNPVGRLWPYVRERHWSNRTYPNLDALKDAASDGWRAVRLYPEMIQTICRGEYSSGT